MKKKQFEMLQRQIDNDSGLWSYVFYCNGFGHVQHVTTPFTLHLLVQDADWVVTVKRKFECCNS